MRILILVGLLISQVSFAKGPPFYPSCGPNHHRVDLKTTFRMSLINQDGLKEISSPVEPYSTSYISVCMNEKNEEDGSLFVYPYHANGMYTVVSREIVFKNGKIVGQAWIKSPRTLMKLEAGH